MRQARLKAPDDHEVAYYHVVSRVVNREFILGEKEREQFVEMMRCYEHFCGVRVLTYCVLSNHFHLLLAVPRRPAVLPGDGELLARAKAVYSPQALGVLRWKLEQWRKDGALAEVEALRAQVCRRMWDLGFYMKGLKQRFGGWFNRRSGRRGTLWEERFKSVLVEGGEALAMVAAYIDLNPVRAGIVADPKDWRWSGYGAALGGVRKARSGLREVMRLHRGAEIGEKDALTAYRAFVFEAAEERAPGSNGTRGRRGAKHGAVAEVKLAAGALSRGELLRHRVRHFADGAALGTKGFVEAVFQKERHRFGTRRKSGARSLAGMEGMCSLRDLKKDAIDPPPSAAKP
jgi:REP element-mobilizing transposase RayT